MSTKISMQAASISTMARSIFRTQFVGKRDREETRRSQIWLEEVAENLAANLTNLHALSHGFVPSHVQRMTGF